MLLRVENLFRYGFKILSETASFRHNTKKAQKALSVVIRDSPVFKTVSTANVQWALVQSMIETEKNKTLTTWSYYYHLPKFTCTTKVRV